MISLSKQAQILPYASRNYYFHVADNVFIRATLSGEIILLVTAFRNYVWPFVALPRDSLIVASSPYLSSLFCYQS